MKLKQGLTPLRSFAAWGATVALLLTTMATPSGGDIGSEPFAADGTVTDVAAPVEPTTFETEGVFTIGDPGLVVSASAYPGVVNNELSIYATTTTKYYKDTGGGAYLASNYANVVVEGELIRVYGRRVLEGGIYRFIATYVWNGPPPSSGGGGGGGGGAIPECGAAGQMANKNFRLHGTVLKPRVHVPCTAIGDQPGGFALKNLAFISPLHAATGVGAYGGVPDVYVTSATAFFIDGKQSDFDAVVKRGVQIRVDGRYEAVGGVYLFLATRVDRFTTVSIPVPYHNLAVREDITGIRTSGDQFTGTSYNGGFFGGTDVTANLVLDGTTLTGDLTLTNPVTGDELILTVEGTVVAFQLDAIVTFAGGSGRFEGGAGMGTLEGTVMPPQDGTTQPQSYNAHLFINVTVPNR
jgi:hypothetical protein